MSEAPTRTLPVAPATQDKDDWLDYFANLFEYTGCTPNAYVYGWPGSGACLVGVIVIAHNMGNPNDPDTDALDAALYDPHATAADILRMDVLTVHGFEAGFMDVTDPHTLSRYTDGNEWAVEVGLSARSQLT